MKRNPILSLACCAAVAFAVLLPTSAVLTGCKGTVQSKAVNTMFTIGSGVDEAYKAYLDLVIMGSVSTNSLPAVSQKYGLFQQAFKAGIEFVSFNTNAAPPQSVLNAAAEFNKAVTTAEGGH